MRHPLYQICDNLNTLVQHGIRYHSESESGHPTISDYSKIRSPDRSLVFVHHGSSLRPFEISALDQRTMRFYRLLADNNGSRDCRIVTVDNFIFICLVVDSGGGTLVNSLLRFDPRHLSLNILMPCRRLRIDPAVVSYDRHIYNFGGCVDTPQGSCGNTILDSVECYDVRGNSWSEVGPMPQPTHSHAAIFVNGLIYLSGGVPASNRSGASVDMLAYNPTTNLYIYKAPMNSARRLHEMAALGNKIFVLGGIGSHTYNHQQTQIAIECYSIDTDQWTILSSTLAGRSIGHFITFENSILSLGREHHQATEDDIWRYDVKLDSWTTYVKAPSRTSLASTSCVLLNINFFDEKNAKKLVCDRR